MYNDPGIRENVGKAVYSRREYDDGGQVTWDGYKTCVQFMIKISKK